MISAPILLYLAAYQMHIFGSGSLSFLSSDPDRTVVSLSFLFPILPLAGMWVSYRLSCRIMEQKEF